VPAHLNHQSSLKRYQRRAERYRAASLPGIYIRRAVQQNKVVRTLNHSLSEEPMSLANTGLKNIYDKLEPKMASNETLLRSELDNIQDGGDVTTAQLLKLQYLISRYTVTATVFAAIIKELGDSLKGVAAKIS
jgi:hypothetical protein